MSEVHNGNSTRIYELETSIMNLRYNDLFINYRGREGVWWAMGHVAM